MISIQQLEYILALSEEKSFNKASEKCFVTQPTLSMQIKKAEEVLGHKLFDRSGSPLTPTTFGKGFIEVARDILNEYGRIGSYLKSFEGKHQEVIRLGVIPTIAVYLIPQMYSLWKKEYKEIRLVIEEMKTEDLIKALSEGRIDLALLSGPYIDPKFRTTRLFSEQILAYYPLASGREMKFGELSEMHPWLLTAGNCLRTQMMHFCGISDELENEDWDYQGGNLELLIDMVDKNGGYTLIPEKFAELRKINVSRIISENGEFPAREIIALSKNKSQKWEAIEPLLRGIQLMYGKATTKEKFTLLDWR